MRKQYPSDITKEGLFSAAKERGWKTLRVCKQTLLSTCALFAHQCTSFQSSNFVQLVHFKEQFEHIRPLLESGRKKTAPRKVDLYEVFCAILYLLKSGCQWRMLPEGFPKWNTVYYYFSIWNKAQDGQQSLLHQCLKKINWRGSYKTGAQVLQQQLSYSRCAEC